MNDTQKMYVKSEPAVPAPTPANPFVNMAITDVLRAFLIGLLVGVVSMGLFYALDRFIFGAALCRPGVEGCTSAPVYSGVIATVVGIIVGIIALAKVGIYRPLPAAIAANIAMWGVFGLVSTHVVWYWGMLIGAVLFGLAYALFAWLARIRSFIISLIVLVVAVVIVRLVIG